MAAVGMEALCPFPLPCPMHLAVPELHPFVIKQGSGKKKKREYKQKGKIKLSAYHKILLESNADTSAFKLPSGQSKDGRWKDTL